MNTDACRSTSREFLSVFIRVDLWPYILRATAGAVDEPLVCWIVMKPTRIAEVGTRHKKPEPRNAREQRAARLATGDRIAVAP